jgi:hypothetical protein
MDKNKKINEALNKLDKNMLNQRKKVKIMVGDLAD